MRIFCIKNCKIAAASGALHSNPHWPPVAGSSAPRTPCCYSRLLIIACLHNQSKSGFIEGPAFIQPIRAIKKVFKKLEKNPPSKKPLLF